MRSAANKVQPQLKKTGMSAWKGIAICMVIIILPWAFYVNFHPKFENIANLTGHQAATDLGQLPTTSTKTEAAALLPVSKGVTQTPRSPVKVQPSSNSLVFPDLPVLGPDPAHGAEPLFGVKHKGTDAIFALACNYPPIYYKRFVGSLRKFGYNEDIVLAVSPVVKMKAGVEAYLKETNVVAYGFDVDCKGTDNCQLKDDFLGYPDPRPYRTFANIRCVYV